MAILGVPVIGELQVGKMLSGSFDEIKEFKNSDGNYYISGTIEGLDHHFFSETYKESKNLEQLQNAGIMNENGDLLL